MLLWFDKHKLARQAIFQLGVFCFVWFHWRILRLAAPMGMLLCASCCEVGNQPCKDTHFSWVCVFWLFSFFFDLHFRIFWRDHGESCAVSYFILWVLMGSYGLFWVCMGSHRSQCVPISSVGFVLWVFTVSDGVWCIHSGVCMYSFVSYGSCTGSRGILRVLGYGFWCVHVGLCGFYGLL